MPSKLGCRCAIDAMDVTWALTVADFLSKMSKPSYSEIAKIVSGEVRDALKNLESMKETCGLDFSRTRGFLDDALVALDASKFEKAETYISDARKVMRERLIICK